MISLPSVAFEWLLEPLVDGQVAVLDRQREDFLSALKEQQASFRELETSVRANLTEQLTKNTVALSETAQVLARV